MGGDTAVDLVGMVLVFVGMPTFFFYAAYIIVDEWRKNADPVQPQRVLGGSNNTNRLIGKGVMRPGKAPYLPSRPVSF